MFVSDNHVFYARLWNYSSLRIYVPYATLKLKLRSQEMLLFASIEVREDKKEVHWLNIVGVSGASFPLCWSPCAPKSACLWYSPRMHRVPRSQHSYIPGSIHDEGANYLVWKFYIFLLYLLRIVQRASRNGSRPHPSNSLSVNAPLGWLALLFVISELSFFFLRLWKLLNYKNVTTLFEAT
jgi:hypothetical protein